MRHVSLSLLLGIFLLLPLTATAQVFCSGIGSSIVCSGDSGMTTQTPLTPRGGMGVIQGPGREVTPYTIIPAPRTTPGIQPLERLDRLPDPGHALTRPSAPPDPLSPIFLPGIGSSYGSGRDVAPY